VSIDSRTLAPGALFVAIAGDRFDGHDFARVAVDRGATGLLVSEDRDWPADATVIRVGHTLEALQQLARAVRRASGARVIAITGSAGKTSTKELTATLLEGRYRVFRNRGNLNNHIGLPLSLVELAAGYDVAVVELGMNHEGEIRTLVAIAEPEVRVWTNVGDAHIGYFGSRDAVARAKAEILEQASPDTLVVANQDDPLVMAHVGSHRGRTLTFGFNASADVHPLSVIDRGFDGTSADLDTPAGRLTLTLALPGRAHLLNTMAAVAVATSLDVPPAEIVTRAAQARPVARRGSIVTLRSGARLVDDSYNASPAAVEAMLSTLAATAHSGRRIAVLGEMRELGDQAMALHEVCGRAAARAGVDWLVAVGGPAADGFASGAISAGLAPERVLRFATADDAAAPVTTLITAGDLVLVKGSRGTRTDVIADALMAQGQA
jgi:UDP-N-acetylmuramoyl-tripeptide--D-alanyl-D-alanine ligase